MIKAQILCFILLQIYINADDTCKGKQDPISCKTSDSCVWTFDKSKGKCFKKDFDCSKFSSKPDCNNNFQCFFEEGRNGYCYNKSSYNCNKQLTKQDCPEKECQWLNSQDCEKKEKAELDLLCANSSTETKCNDNSGFCFPEYECQKKADIQDYCSKPKNECLAEKEICQYIQTSVDKCKYVDGFCENASAETCIQNSEVCQFVEQTPYSCTNVNDNFCSTFTLDQCRSYSKVCNLTLFATVCALINDPCLKIKSTNSCTGNCKWNSSLETCNTNNTPCNSITDLTLCTANPNCFLYNYDCTNKNLNLCTNLSSEDCRANSDFCNYQSSSKTCYLHNDSCISLSQGLCTGECAWNSTQSLCRSKTPTSCDSITDEEECKEKIECLFLDKFTCTKKNDFSCSSKNDVQCKQSYPYCYFQQQIGKCTLKKDPCNDLKDYQTCQKQAKYCDFIYESGYCQFNPSYTCNEISNSDQCSNSKICEYKFKSCQVKNTDFCIDKISVECEKDKPNIPCKPSEKGVCAKASLDCSSLSQDSCLKEKSLCEWKEPIPSKCRDALDCFALDQQKCDQISSYCSYQQEYSCFSKSEIEEEMYSSLLSQSLFSIALLILLCL